MNGMMKICTGNSNPRHGSIWLICHFAVVALLVTVVAMPNLAAESRDEEKRERADQAELPRLPVGQQSVGASPDAPQAPNQGADHWSVMASGGGWSNLGSFRLGATLGQTVAGRVSVGGNQLLVGFWQNFESGSCCVGRVGDANGLGGDQPSIGDIAVMINAKFISMTCDGMIVCLAEGDINQSGGYNPTCDDISIGDISILIDYLFISQQPSLLVDCL